MLNHVELLRATQFEEKHRDCERKVSKKKFKSKPKYKILLYPTGIGMGVHIKCTGCKRDKDISDYASW